MNSHFPAPQDARTLAQFRALGAPTPAPKPRRREDRCEHCKRVVTAFESGYCDLKTGRVWCKRSSCRPVSS
jgi:hypothetical protein